MDLEILIAFSLASIALLSTPGPTTMLVISYALRQGRKTAIATVPGVMLGDVTAMTVSLAGAGAVLAASATLFTVLKLAGAAYLIWLGIQLWRQPTSLNENGISAIEFTKKRMFTQAYIVTALNPKGIMFFTAFVPQFIDVGTPLLPQFIILEMTFVLLGGIAALIWALLAGEIRQRLRRPTTAKLINRIGAAILMTFGVVTATIK